MTRWQTVPTGYHMGGRFDLSDKLIHFVRGERAGDAFSTLRSIIQDCRLFGGNRMIRGGYRCVCFTEAPVAAFAADFVRQFPFTRYSQFGLMFEKSWIYERGGRPVIYQPGDDFDRLPEELRWRHVRFELSGEDVIDFTWEREWRIACDELSFTPADAAIVVPDGQWADALCQLHQIDQDMLVQQYSLVIDQQIAELWRDTFRWQLVTLA
ncbi:MAG: hypothetical protein ABSH32_34800 [Bryobacteraceae bacterium]|jgi:hypothetical protein